jgi:hypothetical protein
MDRPAERHPSHRMPVDGVCTGRTARGRLACCRHCARGRCGRFSLSTPWLACAPQRALILW